jgi:Fur family ferric uptake transcriptional regulator
MTKTRLAVYETLQGSEVPLSAAEIYKRIPMNLDLATVYRSLHYFEDQGKIESFSFTCAEKGTERYFYRRKEPHAHFFHCEGCHKFINLGDCRVGGMLQDIESDYGVKIESHTLYFTGLCGGCSGEPGK